MSQKLPHKLSGEFPFESHYFEGKNGRIHYVDEGSGPVILMFHGNPTWSFLYRDIIKSLKSNYRCIAMDHLGCGLSDKPKDKKLYTLQQHIDRASEWVESLALKSFVVLVHDWGGPIGLGTAARFKNKVEALFITNTAAFPFERIPKRISICRIPVLGDFLVRGFNGFVRAAKTMTTEKPLSDLEKFGYSFPYDSWANRVAINGFVKDIPMDESHPSYSAIEQLENSLEDWVDVPVSLFWGMKDWCFHPMLIPEFKKRISHAEIIEYPDAGHYLFEDAPKEILKDLKAKLSQVYS